MIQQCNSWCTQIWIFLQCLLTKVFCLRTYSSPYWLLKAGLIEPDCWKHVMLCFSLERWLAAKHHVNNDTCSPNIYFLIISFLFNNFWSKIVRTADEITHHPFLIKKCGKTEISQFNAHIDWILKENILWFDISMSDVHFMHVVKRIQQLFSYVNNL